jgi:hypothetical protein
MFAYGIAIHFVRATMRRCVRQQFVGEFLVFAHLSYKFRLRTGWTINSLAGVRNKNRVPDAIIIIKKIMFVIFDY